MGNFKKAFIPLGLSAGFMAVSLFGGVALKATSKSEEVYVPKEVVVESAGGTDEQASSPAELKEKLLKIKSYSGNYYDSLKDNEGDPEPDPEKYNSLAITVDGWVKDSEGKTTMDRKLVVTQNHLGAYYQMDGYSIDNKGTKTDLNAVIGFSKHGMYFLANHYNVTSTGSYEGEEMVKILCDELNANRGKFYKVAVEKEGPSYEQIMMSGDQDAAYDALGYQAAKSVADGLYNSFVKTLNDNNNTLNYLISLLDYFDDEEQVEQYDGEYIAHTSSYNIRVNLRDTAKPNFYIEEKEGKEYQNITLEHINNTKVEIVEQGVGDFGDLLAKPVADYYRKQYEEMMNQGMGA
jgi:hypothetical protein